MLPEYQAKLPVFRRLMSQPILDDALLRDLEVDQPALLPSMQPQQVRSWGFLGV